MYSTRSRDTQRWTRNTRTIDVDGSRGSCGGIRTPVARFKCSPRGCTLFLALACLTRSSPPSTKARGRCAVYPAPMQCSASHTVREVCATRAHVQSTLASAARGLPPRESIRVVESARAEVRHFRVASSPPCTHGPGASAGTGHPPRRSPRRDGVAGARRECREQWRGRGPPATARSGVRSFGRGCIEPSIQCRQGTERK